MASLIGLPAALPAVDGYRRRDRRADRRRHRAAAAAGAVRPARRATRSRQARSPQATAAGIALAQRGHASPRDSSPPSRRAPCCCWHAAGAAHPLERRRRTRAAAQRERSPWSKRARPRVPRTIQRPPVSRASAHPPGDGASASKRTRRRLARDCRASRSVSHAASIVGDGTWQLQAVTAGDRDRRRRPRRALRGDARASAPFATRSRRQRSANSHDQQSSIAQLPAAGAGDPRVGTLIDPVADDRLGGATDQGAG